MRFEKSVVIDGRPEAIWESLWDVEHVAACIRGTSDVVTVADRERYTAVITQKVGPFGVRFPLTIDVVDAAPPDSMVIECAGRDARIGSGMKATMRLRLDPLGDDRTTLVIDTDVSLQGKLASLGQGIIGRKLDEELGYFSDALGKWIQARRRDRE